MHSASESFAHYGGSASTLSAPSQKLTSGGSFEITLRTIITDALISPWDRVSLYLSERYRQPKCNVT
jgi:hypothetical protein